jgi:hypothetical protein
MVGSLTVAFLTTSDQTVPPAPGGVRGRSPIAWAPSHELDAHQWAAAGQRLGVVGRCIQWLLGDWLAYGNSKFGERYARAAQITGYDPQTLMNMVYVASRFSISRRRESLSWSHHETLAALDQGEQDRWLDDTITHRWSVADLRMMLRASRREAVPLETARRDAQALVQPSAKAPSAGPSDGTDACLAPEPAASAKILTCPRCGEQIPLVNDEA